MKPPRVVLDSNIYISGLVFGGIPGAVLVLARIDRFVLCTSEHILEEVENTLAMKFSWSAEQVRRACAPYWKIASLIKPTKALSIVAADPDDDRVLECALDGNADLIVTGDAHLLNLSTSKTPIKHIQILTPRQFLMRVS